MQSQYNLRPVADLSHSPVSHSSTSPPHEPSPHLPPLQYNPAAGPPRRPISPSQLPHLDVSSAGHATNSRIFPPPPSGHELMRLFPPPPPDQFSDTLKPNSTSIYFHRQEHAFFAQAGKEIIRVRVESDFQPARLALAPAAAPLPSAKGKERQWLPPPPAQTPHPHPHPQAYAAPPPPHMHHPHQHMPPPPPPAAAYPQPPPHHMQQPQVHHHAAPPTPSHDEYRDDPDEGWRRPMPYAERRRAGKHTRRVVKALNVNVA
ncbi:hypothetical protein DENSPDRAFT_931419 [Dentipellis sp. KUC8613]|nr:hypothetical protein DENSPDRAFT_931419 [Dentipellis sp. KUC8613]